MSQSKTEKIQSLVTELGQVADSLPKDRASYAITIANRITDEVNNYDLHQDVFWAVIQIQFPRKEFSIPN